MYEEEDYYFNREENSVPYKEGDVARKNGCKRKDNPYNKKTQTESHRLWDKGYFFSWHNNPDAVQQADNLFRMSSMYIGGKKLMKKERKD